MAVSNAKPSLDGMGPATMESPVMTIEDLKQEAAAKMSPTVRGTSIERLSRESSEANIRTQLIIMEAQCK